ncbi:MAG: Gfo/Idh/MocA family oxidoreductase [Parvibaculum sp.]
MTTSPQIRVAIVGLGRRIATVIRHFVAAAPGVTLVGYVDPSPVGKKGLEKAGIEPGPSFDSVEEMLNTAKVDLLMVGSPNHLHLAHIRAGLEAGVRVFSEKPVVRTEEETWALLELLKTHGADRLLVGLVLRSSPLVQAVLAHLPRLGTLISMEGNETLIAEHGAFLMRDWRRASQHGGSFLLDKCCHDFDLYTLFADARAKRVASFGGRRIFTEENRALGNLKYEGGEPAYTLWRAGWNGGNDSFGSDGDVVDHQTALIEFENGVQLAFHANTHAGLPQRRWYLVGTQGTLEADLVSNRLTFRDALARNAPETATVEGDPLEHYGSDPAMGRDLAAHLLEGTPFPVKITDAIVAGLTVMAADRAMATGSVVDCGEMWERVE